MKINLAIWQQRLNNLTGQESSRRWERDEKNGGGKEVNIGEKQRQWVRERERGPKVEEWKLRFPVWGGGWQRRTEEKSLSVVCVCVCMGVVVRVFCQWRWGSVLSITSRNVSSDRSEAERGTIFLRCQMGVKSPNKRSGRCFYCSQRNWVKLI